MNDAEIAAEDIRSLPRPWYPPQINNQIQKVVARQRELNGELSRCVLHNYNDFVRGVQQVQQVETQLSLVNILVKNGRRKFRQTEEDLVLGGLRVATYQQKQSRMQGLLHIMHEMQEVLRLEASLKDHISDDRFGEALHSYGSLKEAIAHSQFAAYPCISALNASADKLLETIKSNLSDGLRVAAISADFDVEKYEHILKGYCLLSETLAFDGNALHSSAAHPLGKTSLTGKPISVAERILDHIYESIQSVSKQCLLAFSQADQNPEGSKFILTHAKILKAPD
eukprot:GEMP01076140.1.p1 GENE.GEMP01076140.1~~GEMP01076140.1.p1  ORF type:complete len:283 (-),score=49.41 GEMP01076140.1:240-1088(-)